MSYLKIKKQPKRKDKILCIVNFFCEYIIIFYSNFRQIFHCFPSFWRKFRGSNSERSFIKLNEFVCDFFCRLVYPNQKFSVMQIHGPKKPDSENLNALNNKLECSQDWREKKPDQLTEKNIRKNEVN